LSFLRETFFFGLILTQQLLLRKAFRQRDLINSIPDVQNKRTIPIQSIAVKQDPLTQQRFREWNVFLIGTELASIQISYLRQSDHRILVKPTTTELHTFHQHNTVPRMLVYQPSAEGCSTSSTPSSSQSSSPPRSKARYAKGNRESSISSRKHNAILYAGCFLIGMVICYMIMNSISRTQNERLELELQSHKNTVEILE
jgi:hypothetical protein